MMVVATDWPAKNWVYGLFIYKLQSITGRMQDGLCEVIPTREFAFYFFLLACGLVRHDMHWTLLSNSHIKICEITSLINIRSVPQRHDIDGRSCGHICDIGATGQSIKNTTRLEFYAVA